MGEDIGGLPESRRSIDTSCGRVVSLARHLTPADAGLPTQCPNFVSPKTVSAALPWTSVSGESDIPRVRVRFGRHRSGAHRARGASRGGGAAGAPYDNGRVPTMDELLAQHGIAGPDADH